MNDAERRARVEDEIDYRLAWLLDELPLSGGDAPPAEERFVFPYPTLLAWLRLAYAVGYRDAAEEPSPGAWLRRLGYRVERRDV